MLIFIGRHLSLPSTLRLSTSSHLPFDTPFRLINPTSAAFPWVLPPFYFDPPEWDAALFDSCIQSLPGV
jgi:hypothetical protein